MPARIIPSSFPIGTPFARLTTTTLPYQKQRMRRRGPYLDWYVTCRCSCGNVKEYIFLLVRQGHTTSCGCLQTENRITHGMSKTKIYQTWQSMIGRCYNERDEAYKYYGGRGISVCPQWRESFETFYRDVGPRPSEEHSLDRYPNNDGDYEPGNTRWALRVEQMGNTRRNHLLTVDGRTECLAVWAREAGISYVSILKRIKSGMDVAAAVSTPRRDRSRRQVDSPENR